MIERERRHMRRGNRKAEQGNARARRRWIEEVSSIFIVSPLPLFKFTDEQAQEFLQLRIQGAGLITSRVLT